MLLILLIASYFHIDHRRKTCITENPYLVTVTENHVITEKRGHIAISASRKVAGPVSELINQKLAILSRFLA